MSIDLNWETLTGGPDGEALAERIRAFVHDKFQTVPLPRFIKSVNVHSFDFGTVPPQLELKDITDPLPEFYELDGDDDDESSSDGDGSSEATGEGAYHNRRYDDDDDADRDRAAREVASGVLHMQSSGGRPPARGELPAKRPSRLRTEALRGGGFFGGGGGGVATPGSWHGGDMSSSFLGASTPGIMGGPGLSYFHGQFGTGTHTPLAAVAGAHMGGSWLGSAAGGEGVASPSSQGSFGSSPGYRHSRQPSQSSISVDYNFPVTVSPAAGSASAASGTPSGALKEKHSVSTLAPTASSVGTSRPPTRDAQLSGSAMDEDDDDDGVDAYGQPLGGSGEDDARSRREPRLEDVQAVFRIQYTGNVRLNLTAEILLDYPMPSFVGIPLKLNITGLSFDGVGVLAKIRRRLNFCFLGPEDALAAVGPETPGTEQRAGEEGSSGGNSHGQHGGGSGGGGGGMGARLGGLLQEIKVESEIGGRQGGKQSLKNVGKVERFVLDQVRRIFEEELVYPSYWTFLV